MRKRHSFYTNTPLANAVAELFQRLEERLELAIPVNVYLAGGVAVHFYTGDRSTTDLDAEPMTEMDTGHFKVYALSPVDLAVSMIARLAENDREDIKALVRLGLTSSSAIRQRADDAVTGYIGSQRMPKGNIESAVSIAGDVEGERGQSNSDNGM